MTHEISTQEEFNAALKEHFCTKDSPYVYRQDLKDYTFRDMSIKDIKFLYGSLVDCKFVSCKIRDLTFRIVYLDNVVFDNCEFAEDNINICDRVISVPDKKSFSISTNRDDKHAITIKAREDLTLELHFSMYCGRLVYTAANNVKDKKDTLEGWKQGSTNLIEMEKAASLFIAHSSD